MTYGTGLYGCFQESVHCGTMELAAGKSTRGTRPKDITGVVKSPRKAVLEVFISVRAVAVESHRTARRKKVERDGKGKVAGRHPS